jgi:hypothetical protein
MRSGRAAGSFAGMTGSERSLMLAPCGDLESNQRAEPGEDAGAGEAGDERQDRERGPEQAPAREVEPLER